MMLFVFTSFVLQIVVEVLVSLYSLPIKITKKLRTMVTISAGVDDISDELIEINHGQHSSLTPIAELHARPVIPIAARKWEFPNLKRQ